MNTTSLAVGSIRGSNQRGAGFLRVGVGTWGLRRPIGRAGPFKLTQPKLPPYRALKLQGALGSNLVPIARCTMHSDWMPTRFEIALFIAAATLMVGGFLMFNEMTFLEQPQELSRSVTHPAHF
jgi:hypothetical protein